MTPEINRTHMMTRHSAFKSDSVNLDYFSATSKAFVDQFLRPFYR